MEFLGLFLSAIVVEGIISYIKLFFVEGKFQWQNIVAIALGVFVAIIYQVDIFNIFGMMPLVPYVGTTLTGILISRGSNYIYQIVKIVMNFTSAATTNFSDK